MNVNDGLTKRIQRPQISGCDKMGSLYNLEMIELLTRQHLVGCKWVFTLKYNSNGNIACYKAWLVAQGFAQVYGMIILRHLLLLQA